MNILSSSNFTVQFWEGKIRKIARGDLFSRIKIGSWMCGGLRASQSDNMDLKCKNMEDKAIVKNLSSCLTEEIFSSSNFQGHNKVILKHRK